MRMLKNEAGKVIGVATGDEPKVKRPGPEPITTHNVNPLTREERAARALGAQVKAEAEKGAKNAKA